MLAVLPSVLVSSAFLYVSVAQILDGVQLENHGICGSIEWQNVKDPPKAENCSVIVGHLMINLENSTTHDFENNTAFMNLREVTGFVTLYRVVGLRSLSQLLPNLTLIRGQQLIRNYALGLHTMPDLTEIGLYNLLRIERGGVMVWNCPKACFVDTINWDAIAPRGRQIIVKSNAKCEGHDACRCMNYPDIDYCWNRKRCQRLLSGPVAENCHEQCMGCRKTDGKCSRCRNYTDNNLCVPKCSDHKVILPQTKRCLTREECFKLFDGMGSISNGTCMKICPKGYKFEPFESPMDNETCKKTDRYMQNNVCEGSRDIVQIGSLTDAYKYSHCVVINGSLVIKLHSNEYALEDLRNLKNIKEIKDYLMIYSSVGITSLGFLENLKIIHGRTLWKSKYAIVIREMKSLRTLFPPQQAKEMKIKNGTILAYNNPQLCMTEIESFHAYIKWPMGHRADISSTSNGYFGECQNINIPLNVTATGEKSAIASFRHISSQRNPDVYFKYSLHYVEVFPGLNVKKVPFYCSDQAWKIIAINASASEVEVLNITNLRPSTIYALYVEASHTSSPLQLNENLTDYGTSKVENFTTVVGLPPPPFIVEIASLSAHSFALNWVDHLNYGPHVTRYLLDVSIINYDARMIDSKDQCRESFTFTERTIEDRYHVTVRAPPAEYGEICVCNRSIHFRRSKSYIFQKWRSDPTFEFLSPVLKSELFDVCGASGINCDNAWEVGLLKNVTVDGVVQSLGVELLAPQNQYVVRGLLPFHDYRVRLRACTGPLEDNCGRSARETIRTQMIRDNDIVHLKNATLKNGEFILTWDPPVTPNGYILAFIVQVKSSKIREICITRVEHENNGRIFVFVHEIPLEEYSVRVCTSSMAADRICGAWVTKTIPDRLSVILPIIGIIVILIIIVSWILIRWWRRRTANEDRAHLLENFELLPIHSEVPAEYT